MGFDKHFYEDHCYLDDPTNNVGMNVEIIEDSSNIVENTMSCDKSPIRYAIDITHQSKMYCETSTNSEPYDYDPYLDICRKHSDLILLEDANLVKPGDKFHSHEQFVQYLNENAKRWLYYYKCSDSRKPNTDNESYTYNCVYQRNKEKYKKKGLRKRSNNMKTDCPCKIKLRHLPNEKELTVVFVCNHHDHELSVEQFRKLQHGRRLPPYIREEILDFLALQVDKGKIKKYVEMETGFSMGRPFFNALEKNILKTKNLQRHITEDRLKMLQEKIAAVEQELQNCNKNQGHAEQKTKTSDETFLTDFPKTTRLELRHEEHSNENVQSEEITQEDSKCEIQTNPWVSDQCVPILPNRTELSTNSNDTRQYNEPNTMTDSDTESFTYRLEYYNPNTNTQETYELTRANVKQIEQHSNDIHNIAYETVVSDENINTHNEIQEYVDNDEQITIYNDNSQEVISNVGQQFENTQDIIQFDDVEYVNGDNEQLVQYIEETNDVVNETDDAQSAHDIGVQTNKSEDSSQMLLPVFDVYMKDGNVTGFVLNDNVINGLKDGVDKGIQTSEDIMYNDMLEIENEDSEIIQDTTEHAGDTYTKHEYVHKYNIEQYMTQPNFPKYVDILGKETYTDVLSMLTNVFNEKAMFKLTTTQRGNEGNTRICYVTHDGKIKKKKTDVAKKEKLGKQLHSVFVLKEKLRMLKKQNDELLKRNKYLEDVALKFVNLG